MISTQIFEQNKTSKKHKKAIKRQIHKNFIWHMSFFSNDLFYKFMQCLQKSGLQNKLETMLVKLFIFLKLKAIKMQTRYMPGKTQVMDDNLKDFRWYYLISKNYISLLEHKNSQHFGNISRLHMYLTYLKLNTPNEFKNYVNNSYSTKNYKPVVEIIQINLIQNKWKFYMTLKFMLAIHKNIKNRYVKVEDILSKLYRKKKMKKLDKKINLYQFLKNQEDFFKRKGFYLDYKLEPSVFLKQTLNTKNL